MSAANDGPVETWPVAQRSALSGTAPIAVMGAAEKYGFAVLAEDEWTVKTFDDRASRNRALARIFTLRAKWGYPLSWEQVFVFEPDKPIRLRLEIEPDEEEADE